MFLNQKASAAVVGSEIRTCEAPPPTAQFISVYSTWPSVAMSNEERIKLW